MISHLPTNLEETLSALLALRQQMLASRQSPDGGVHAPPSDAELVLEAIGECLVALAKRITALEDVAPRTSSTDYTG